jgi:hypothetical protein
MTRGHNMHSLPYRRVLIRKLADIGYPKGVKYVGEGAEGVVFKVSADKVAKFWILDDITSWDFWRDLHHGRYEYLAAGFPKIYDFYDFNELPVAGVYGALMIVEKVRPLKNWVPYSGVYGLPTAYRPVRKALRALCEDRAHDAFQEAGEHIELVRLFAEIIKVADRDFGYHELLSQLGVTKDGRLVNYDLI